MRCALTIAGSDSIGGAGIQADIKAMGSLGVHACAVVTAVTAQNTTAVERIYPMPVDMVQDQLEAVLKDVDIKAIKTGMLYSAEIVETVADVLEDHEMPLIIDPVMVAGVGDSLATKDLARAIKRDLMPLCELITPNRHEAEILAGMPIRTEDDATLACELIGKEGSSVLLKGGHFTGKNVTDYLYLSSEFTRMEYPRLERAGHGGGCTLSSFITANMAKGMDIVNAVMRSRELIQKSIASMYVIGEGDKVVNPMVKTQDDSVKFGILDAIDTAADQIVDMLPQDYVPALGTNIAYSLPNPAGPEDIAAIENRITFHNGSLRKNGKAKYGSAEHASYLLLSVIKFNPELRSTMNIEYSEELRDIIEEVGLDILDLDRKKYKDLRLGELTTATVKEYGYVPDVFIDRESGKKNNIRILGKNPDDVLSKLRLFL
ncbi:MAG: bifunctional hydroxymethylpyrimidine kinase/phosphomethylpyrimidine kinase [Candidatus Methanomethylophilaceae archaeon]|nr:bifunctional hydroxymethylpyrimidine kinase/phosphomethylpyrimidine kinase [Candidatus Methanomethylophilaceae archaeon]